MNLQTDKVFQEALKEASVAKTIGSATANHIRSLFEQLDHQHQPKAFIALLMQIASAVAKNEHSPDIIFSNTNDFLARASLGRNNNSSGGPSVRKFTKVSNSLWLRLIQSPSKSGLL